jgi:hypothetical protein
MGNKDSTDVVPNILPFIMLHSPNAEIVPGCTMGSKFPPSEAGDWPDSERGK